MLLFVVVVWVTGAQGLHLGAALSFILQIADQIVSRNFYRLQRLPSHGQLGAKDGGFCRENVKSSQNYLLELTAALLLSVH